jgi:hypothetical protein
VSVVDGKSGDNVGKDVIDLRDFLKPPAIEIILKLSLWENVVDDRTFPDYAADSPRTISPADSTNCACKLPPLTRQIEGWQQKR